jgi:hypothetical protein
VYFSKLMKFDTIWKTGRVKLHFKALQYTNTFLICQYVNNVHIIQFNLSSYEVCMCPSKEQEVKRIKLQFCQLFHMNMQLCLLLSGK